jgi:ATP-dependent Lhr-like helicase
VRRSVPRSGRWSRFPAHLPPASPADRIERWAWQLLKRYGVVFRDLMARESVAPAWGALAPVFRRLEARGKIRGGRFVARVGGEQFATSEAVEQLRRVRK